MPISPRADCLAPRILALLVAASTGCLSPGEARKARFEAEPRRELDARERACMADSAADACLTLVVQNELGPRFELESVLTQLDGEVVFSSHDEALTGTRRIDALSAVSLAARQHTFDFEMVFRWKGVAPFESWEGYKFKLRKRDLLTVTAGTFTEARLVAFDRTPLIAPVRTRSSPGLLFYSRPLR